MTRRPRSSQATCSSTRGFKIELLRATETCRRYSWTPAWCTAFNQANAMLRRSFRYISCKAGGKFFTTNSASTVSEKIRSANARGGSSITVEATGSRAVSVRLKPWNTSHTMNATSSPPAEVYKKISIIVWLNSAYQVSANPGQSDQTVLQAQIGS